MNIIGIPKGSALLCTAPEIKIEVGTLEGLAFYVNGTDLPDEIYESCDINHVIEQMESAMNGIGRFIVIGKVMNGQPCILRGFIC